MKIKVDLGRIVPGVLIFIGGLIALFVMLLVMAVSYLFSFIPLWASVYSTLLWLSAVPALVMAGGAVIAFTGLSWGSWNGAGWFSGIAEARARVDRLRTSGRAGELIGAGVTIIIFAFLYANQLRGAQFFTTGFGSLEQFLFYAPLFTGIALAVSRAVYGRRNGIRPFDSLNDLFLAVSAFYLLSVFPFDFTKLGYMFPSEIQILFLWLTNDIGRLVFFIAGTAAIVSFVYTSVLYLSVRDLLTHSMGPKKL